MPNQYLSPKNLLKSKFLLKFIGLVGTLVINWSFTRPVFAAFLTNWFFDPDNNQLQFTLPSGTAPSFSLENKPARLIVYIPNTEVSVDVTELYPAGLVRRVSLSQEQPEQAKVIIDFAPEVVISSKQVQLEQVEPQENSWQLRLLMAEGAFSEPPEIISDPQATEPETTEVENSQTTASQATEPETTEVENSQTTEEEEDNQTSTQPKQDSVGLLDTAPEQESPLPNPGPSAEPSVPFLVIPTDRPGRFRSPIVDALSNEKPETESSQVEETPTLETREEEETVISLPPESIEESKNTTESVSVVTFGEPLPGSSGPKQSEDDASILIEEGEVIGLIYPSQDVRLPRDIEIQEVLLLKEAIVDESGRVIVPARTPVVGGFDTTTRGSKFIARAIYVDERLIPFSAESELLRGHPNVNEKVLAASSAGGGLGLLLLTGSGFGFLAGAALGAGSVVLTSPRSVTLEGDIVIEVRVVKDLPRSRFYEDIGSF
ncbi:MULTISPECIES: AMIN domain-containing protein [unclassified Okeania]|uniref:AMIN domain-containing protein n=1 Tax=unclassified Okeania TaxID=2634635 RepID=UPI0013B8735F|nr:MULTISPECIES: AMIN domain-containing protein [unclassified Okeania]NES77735.1 AMIN domain-containing protein [Okeania sp. SIO1H4]NET12150.1 AMIN domain-containing protein [Okeania sp. SIO1H6]NET21340.1 AMIN domain-containing protein [Okeania sp. SIO1H5]NET94553.1 AMIN domain-containing protein [Okeania sp. SIO1H2]